MYAEILPNFLPINSSLGILGRVKITMSLVVDVVKESGGRWCTQKERQRGKNNKHL